MTRDVLIVFVKAPRAGSVKTRLAAAVGDQVAVAFYRAMAEEVLRRTSPEAGEYERVVAFAPADAGAELEGWLPGEALWPQAEGDLGARMAAAFGEAFARGAARVALVGSDVPWLARASVREAFARLAACDVVLGPAEDGGYYLVALARRHTELFQGIAWSRSTVLAATLARARDLGLTVSLLETLPDVDGPEDVRRHWRRLQPLLARHAVLRAALAPPS